MDAEFSAMLSPILIPLSTSNHSVKEVLIAELKVSGESLETYFPKSEYVQYLRFQAWHTLLQTSTLCKSISREKGIPSLLKILYGPHTLDTALSHSDLLELCGMVSGRLAINAMTNLY